MSIVTWNGAVLPDVPTSSEYTYGAICEAKFGDTIAHALIASTEELVLCPAGISDSYSEPTLVASGTWISLMVDTDANEWVVMNGPVTEVMTQPLSENGYVVWANRDIKLVAGFNDDGTPILGDTFYYGVEDQSPDALTTIEGVMLPPLDSEAMEVFPYSILFRMSMKSGSYSNNQLVAFMFDTPFAVAPMDLTGEEYDILVSASSGIIGVGSYNPVANMWEYTEEDASEFTGCPLAHTEESGYSIDYSIQWTNHDIMYADSVDMESDVPAFTVGTEVYMENMAGPKPPKNVVLPDGTELAPYPEGYLDTYKYSMIFKEDSQSSNTYYLVSYPSELYKIAPNTLTNSYEALTCLTVGYQVWSVTVGDEGWVSLPARRDVGKFLSSDIIDAPIEVSLNSGNVVDWTTGWYTLPDGTDVPPIPDDVFTNHPYRLVLRSIDLSTNKEIYVMSESSDELVFYNNALVIEDGVSHKAWQCDANELSLWTARDDNESLPISDIIWVNYDIMNASDSSSVYRMSDVSYRAYEGWAKSIGDEIRRLSETVDDLTPKKMEETLRSLETPLIDCETEVY